MQALDLNRLRDETPSCKQVLHFNNAGASLPPLVVVNSIKEMLDLEAQIGGYEAADYNEQKIEQFYKSAAKLINCKPEEIAFVENATRAWDMAFYSLKFNPGDKVISSSYEYGSNYLAFLQKAKNKGIEIINISYDQSGLNIKELESKIDDKVKLISLPHVPSQSGLINPIQEVGLLAKKYEIPYLVDTTQSIGQIPIDVQTIHCDFLCATGRKFLRGPRGTGFLYVRKEKLELCDPPFVDLQAAHWTKSDSYLLREDARRFETWEQNFALKIGLTTAIDYALNLSLEAIWERVQCLAKRLRKQLDAIPEVTLQDEGKNHCGIITFSCQALEPAYIQREFRRQHINVSLAIEEYCRMDFSKRGFKSLVRASIHYYNSEEEIDKFCDSLQGLLRKNKTN